MNEKNVTRYVPEDQGTPHFDFLSGAFRLSSWTLPYFFITMSLEDANDLLNLVSELPLNEQTHWKVEALYQREINWLRVERDIIPYLRKDKLQFFNSITIALLPFNEKEQKTLPDFENYNEWKPPDLNNDSKRFPKTHTVGPVSFGFWEQWDSPADPQFRSGQLRWNKKQIYGVIIDGQHRLAAIKSLVNDYAYKSSPSTEETRIPVVILIFDKELGFDSSDDQTYTQINLLRELFIDLNKHAQPVSRARQILLDDQDPHAICVQKLLAKEVTDDFKSLDETQPNLPLSLVDWHTEQGKFETGPYITTVLNLEWIVSKVFKTNPISYSLNYEQIESQIKGLVSSLEIDLTEAKERIRKEKEFELVPFSYTSDELAEIVKAFRYLWVKPICRVLTEFDPYKSLLELRENHESTSMNFQHWYSLFEKARSEKIGKTEETTHQNYATRNYRKFTENLNNRSEKSVSNQFEELLSEIDDYKDGNLAFTVVFQRALIEAFIEYANVKPEDIDELFHLYDQEIDFDQNCDFDAIQEHDHFSKEDSEDSFLENYNDKAVQLNIRSIEFMEALNHFFTQCPEALNLKATIGEENTQKLKVLFWQGTLLNIEGNIDYSKAAATRAKDLIFIIATLYIYRKETKSDTNPDSSTFDDVWEKCRSEDSSSPSICRRVGKAIKRYAPKKPKSGRINRRAAAYRILTARDGDHDDFEEGLEERALKEAYHRVHQIWNVLDL